MFGDRPGFISPFLFGDGKAIATVTVRVGKYLAIAYMLFKIAAPFNRSL
jgi:hypothetical protein